MFPGAGVGEKGPEGTRRKQSEGAEGEVELRWVEGAVSGVVV